MFGCGLNSRCEQWLEHNKRNCTCNIGYHMRSSGVTNIPNVELFEPSIVIDGATPWLTDNDCIGEYGEFALFFFFYDAEKCSSIDFFH